MPKWIPARAVLRMASRRSIPRLWGWAPHIQSMWRASAHFTGTHEYDDVLPAEQRGGLDPYTEQVYQTQSEMFVMQVDGRNPRPGLDPDAGMTWRLSWVEAEMGLPDGEMMGMTYAARRERITSRLRSWRLPTMQTIRLIAQAYSGNDVQVSMDYQAHSITIRFTGKTLPITLEQLKSELIRVVPARLGMINFVVTFLTWGDLGEWGGTWEQLEGMTWEELENAAREELPVPAP
jgi:hypothetical protein